MPHQPVELADGVNVNRTPALNQFGLSFSQLIRYQYDDDQRPMVQKLGGWTRYLTTTTPAPVRALHGWEDTNGVKHLAYGTEAYGAPLRGQLAVITAGSVTDLTPTSLTTNSPPNAQTNAGSPNVIITDPAISNVTAFDTVNILTYIAVGGLVLSGPYKVTPINSTQYQITATDILGNPVPATTTDSPGVVAIRSTTAGSPVVQVTIPNHGKSAGDNYAAMVAQTIGGVTIQGNYTVQNVLSPNVFTILADTTATATDSQPINGGNVQYLYSFGIGPVQPPTGFGMGGFGQGPFGGSGQTGPAATGTRIVAYDWTLDNFGQVLLSCPIVDGPGDVDTGVGDTDVDYQPIYQWDPLSGSPQASVIPEAPIVNDGFFVGMPQRQVIAWGSTDTGIQDPLMVRWCDVNNFHNWIPNPATGSQAGKFRIPRGSKIVGGIQGPQQGLLWTDLSIWSMQYIGPPYIYSFNEIATGCGLISRKAAAAANGVVYWMGPTQFFSLTSNGVQPLACPVWDVAFQDIDEDNIDHIRVAVNSRFNEIAWYIPTLGSGGEVSTYLKYNYALGWWDTGLLQRSAWIDQSVLGAPIGADPTRLLIYQHETSNDADGEPLVASFGTGYFTLNEGDLKTFVDEVWPDAKYGDYNQPQNATLQITFSLADFPEQPPLVLGPFSVSQLSTWFNLRARARLFAFNLQSLDVGTFWRLGRFRYRGQAAGRYG